MIHTIVHGILLLIIVMLPPTLLLLLDMTMAQDSILHSRICNTCSNTIIITSITMRVRHKQQPPGGIIILHLDTILVDILVILLGLVEVYTPLQQFSCPET